MTYAELSAAAVGAAGALRAMAGPGADCAAIALPPGEDFVVALHGCLLAGLAAVPVDLRLGDEERARRMAGAGVVIDQPLGTARGGTPAAPSGPSPVIFSGDAAVAIMHTSGTTAAPKPVTLTHDNFMASALGSTVALGVDVDERWLCPMPLTHVGGLSIPIRSAIYATTAILHGAFETQRVLAELMDPARRVTLVSLVPTMLSRLLDAGLERPPTLRWALVGGGPIAPELVASAKRAGVPVAPTYGMTEACSQIATFGWPLAGVELRLDGSGREVLVRGPIVAPGALSDDGWLHTGDVGEFDERGRLQIAGRLSDTIVTGGENVAPAEIEEALLAHPAVSDAAVVGRPDPEWGEAIVALVVPRDGQVVDPDELRSHCRARLAGFKVPKVVELVEALPRTASGKLLRRELG
jgi:O-succinylbenzoic acid--CoA ligase